MRYILHPKHYTNKIVLLLLLSICTLIANAQITNGAVNYQLKAQSYWSGMNNDGLSTDDNEIGLWVGTDGNSGGTKTLNNVGNSITCTGINFETWDCNAGCNRNDVDRNIYVCTGVTAAANMQFTLNTKCWESDNGMNDCNYVSGDDYRHEMNYVVGFKTGEANNITFPANSFSYNYGSNTPKDGWVNGNWSVTSGSRNSDVRIKTIWRYTYGYDCNNPLDFGTITVGAAAKTHINTNRPTPSGADGNMGYNNAIGNAAPDVYYQFTLTTDATVVISTVSGSTDFDTYLRLFNSNCSVEIANNDDFSSNQAQITKYLCAGTYKILVEGYTSNSGNFVLSVSANSTTPAVPASPVAGTFGTNQWNVYGYNGNNIDLSGLTYKGYYTETGLSYNSNSQWATDASPSFSSTWNGNCVNVDYHTVVSKRQGFPCKIYRLDIPTHDDDIRVYINGTQVYQHLAGCCDAHSNIWTGYLNSASTIEVRHIDGTGGSQQALNLVDVTPTLNGGTIAGITNNTNVCQGTDPGAFTNSASASGGTIGITNGSPAAHTYQWQRATDAGFTVGVTNVGTNATTYDPDNSLTGGTYYFRRAVTDACGTVAYSNTIQINVIHNISTTPPTATAATGGTCTQWRANWNAVTGATGYYLDVATDAAFSSMVSGFNNLNVGNVTSYDLNLQLGTYYYRVRAYNSCFTSSNSNSINFTLSNVANNDLYKNAIDITANIAGGGAYSGSFNNSSYGTESGEPTPNGVYASAWYKFTTPSGGFTSIDAYQAESGSDNTAIAIYRSNGGTCPFGNLTQLADNYWCSSSSGTVTTNCLQGNTTYYIQYGTQDCTLDGGSKGSYNITITPGSVASPDDICNAITLGGSTLDPGEAVNNTVVNNTCASRQGSEPHGDIFNTVWYKFVTPSTGLESVSFHLGENGGGSDNPAIVAYISTGGCTFGALTEVGNDIPGLGTDANSDFNVNCLAPNSTYYIQCGYNDRTLDGGSAGVFDLDIAASSYATGPDNICNAVSMGTLNGTTASLSINNQSNICAGTQTNEPGGGQKTVWYSFTTGATVGRTINVNMDAFGNGLNADVYLYRACGTVCSGSTLNAGVLQEIGNWYDVNPLSGEYDAGGSVDGTILPNTTYYIRADGVPTVGEDGQFNLSVSFSGGAPIANDNYCGAASLGTGFNYNSSALSASGNTDNASSEDICSTNEPDNSNEKSLWWKFTTGANPPAIITVNPSASGVCTGQAFVYSGSASGACTGSAFSNYNTATNFNGLTLIDYTNTGGNININCPTANTTYYIQGQVGGVCSSGALSITVTSNGAPKLGNDLCAGAISLGTLTAGGTIGDATGANRWNNFCATTAGDPNPGWGITDPYQTVWFKFNTGSVGRNVTIEGYNDPGSWGDQIDLKLALYGGPCTPTNATLIDKDYDIAFYSETMEGNYCLTPNTDYYILVSGSNFEPITGSTKEGFFGLTVKDNGPYPANDLVCNATALPVQTQYTYNSAFLNNQDNTRGTNCFEPNPDWTAELGQDNDHGVWYYVGQIPGRTMVVDANDLSGDNIDMQLALYSSTTAKGSCTTPGSTPALTFVQTEYNVLSRDEDAYFNCLNPNLYYWLMVDGSDVTGTGIASALEEGTFSLRAWFPEEGEITGCAAENLGTIPTGSSITVKNLSNICGASSITNFPAPSSFAFDKAVVYRFTTPASPGFTDASIKIEATTNPYYDQATYTGAGGGAGGNMGTFAGDDIDLQLAVYSYGACGSSHFVVGSNYDPTDIDVTSGGSNESVIVNCLLPNTEYYLVVDGGPLNTNGYYDLKLSDYGKHTTNDFLCNAIDITATNSSPWTDCNSSTVVTLTGQNNYCGTVTNDIPSSLGIRPPAWSEMNGPVWCKFKAPKSGKLKIEAINTISDLIPPYDEPEISTQLAVFFLPGGYSGTCSNLSTEKERLQYIGSNHDALFHDEEYEIECLMPDSIYYLLVDGSSETLCPGCPKGEFYLKLTADPRDRPAPNDLICDAIDLGTPAVWTNPTIYDTKVSPAGGAGSYSSPTTGYPTNTGLHNGARNNAYSCMRAENNFCAGIAGEPAVSGGTFFSDFTPDATVWYKFTAPSTGEVLINTYNDPDNRGDAIYTQIAVFETSDNTCTGTMVGIGTAGVPNLITGNNDLTVKCLDPGKTYFIMVDGAGVNINGYFELQVQAVPATLTGPPNDDICNATAVTYPASIGTTTTVNNQTNRCATIQNVYSEPTTFTKDADVWYKFTTPNTAGPHAVEVTVTSGLPWPFGDAMDPQIALYTGTCPSSFTLVEDDYSPLGLPFYESFEFHCLEPNTTYYLMVDGSGLNEQGNFKVDIKRINPHPLPTNDDICQVGTTPANGYLGVLGGTMNNKVGNTTTNWHNFCSDVETNESVLMTDGNYSLDQTVWFHFRTPNVTNNIDVEIRALNDPNNVGDQIDLQMLLVQGNPTCPFNASTTWSSLSPIESDDPALTFNSTIRTCLPPNQDFYIQVDGSGLNTQGYFTIEVENMGTTSAPVNDNICNAKILPSGGAITGSYTGYLNDNNICATLENFEVQQAAGSIQRSVWYKFVAPTSADVSVQVKGNSWVPFTSNYFLPDVTIWELSDDTYATIDNTIAGCPTPTAANWSKLQYNDYQVIPNSLANGLYPTVTLTPLCLKPGYTYYVQVDGVAGIGLDGYFDITIKNNQVPYSAPTNNEAASAATVPISSTTCQYSTGTWQGAYSFGNNPTWSNPNLIGIPNASGIPACTQNCGDVWYKFQVPPACGNNTKTFIKIEGDDEFNFDLNGYPELAIAAYSGPSSGSTSTLTYLKCSVGGTAVDPDFSISANPGDWVYLQIWDLAGNEQDKTFKLCVSEQKSADDCADATNMNLDIPYCWSVESNTGETPNSAIPGSGLNTCFGSGVPKHSTYFKFTTDATTNFCDDYYIYINTTALAKAMPSGANHACISGSSASVSLNMSLYQLIGTPCTPGNTNATLEDCQTWNDCGGGSIGANVVGPHGNGGEIKDTIWYNLNTGNALLPNTTYYIVLDYAIENPLYEDRVILDGIIEVGRRCKGRVWEYTTAPSVTTNKYCTDKNGWRNYYDDKGTPATNDDKYIFSVYPNGNNFEGTVTITLDNTFHRFEDFSNHFAEYVMRRRWDYQVNSGTITNPVKVRFYYQNSEKQEIITAAQNFAVMYPSNYEDFEWFKSANGHVFNPYTDVNPKVISVGPNGYSETGCLSYWTDAGVYVGPPGVQRCIQKVITDWDDNNTYHEWCNGIHFCEYNGLTGFSGGTGGTGDSPWDVSPLPVELISFTGYNNGAINVLDWTTASEKNTLKFEVERKSASNNTFTYIGEKPAAGNSNSVINYTLNDESPEVGDNFYRLKMIDIDGSFTYSQTIVITNKDAENYQDLISKIYPNPANQILFIDYQSSSNSNIKLKIYDALGQEMLMDKLVTRKGNQQFKLDVSQFANGVYIINIQDENTGKVMQTKFVKE